MTWETINKPALPYPKSSEIRVFKDDGEWDKYASWFDRHSSTLSYLYVETYYLEVDKDGDLAMSLRSWDGFARFLIEKHPNCVFVYT